MTLLQTKKSFLKSLSKFILILVSGKNNTVDKIKKIIKIVIEAALKSARSQETVKRLRIASSPPRIINKNLKLKLKISILN